MKIYIEDARHEGKIDGTVSGAIWNWAYHYA